MIKFFRKIRYQLLSEGKTSKYLKYAIGEIVLVVIGILIALSINTWNQNRITKLKEKKSLIQLVQNLNSNLEQFSNNIENEKDRIKDIEVLIDYVENKRPYDTLLRLHNERVGYWEHITINASTYEGLKANNFDIVSYETLKNQIIELFEVNYSNYKEIVNAVAAAEAVSLTNPMQLKYELFNAVNYEKAMNDLEYLNYLYSRKRWKIDVIKTNEGLIPPTQELIERIERGLNTKD